MPILDENHQTSNFALRQSIKKLIYGRVIIAVLLLAATSVWYSEQLHLDLPWLSRRVPLIFIATFVLSAIYLLAVRFTRHLYSLLWTQFILDSVLITLLIWNTGHFSSPYVTLYFVLIGVSSQYFRRMPTLAVALICVFMFSALAFIAGSRAIETAGPQLPFSKISEIVSFHIVAFLVVGLLSSRLADRRFSGEKLEETTKTLANLRALHERIIESIRSGLITTDLDGTIYTFNAAAAEITGFSADEVRGNSIYSLFGDIREQINAAVEQGSNIDQLPRYEANLETPDGFALHIGYSISELYSEENESTGLIITFQDLTEIRSMEENVRRKDRLAAVGRIAAGLAHEIRNPLGAMRGAIQVLQSGLPADSSNRELMDIILRESDRLNNIITNFLNYAKPKAGNFSEIDVCESVRETVRLLKHSPEISEAHSIETVLPDAPIIISADSTQLKQIFWNLSRNAAKAMPNGGKLTIGVEDILNNRIKITFTDTGVGMSPESVEQLFEPFSQSTTGGTGLGLSIVYQIVRDHNGVINVRSIEGEGTTISIEFPKNDPAAKRTDNDKGRSADDLKLKQFIKVKNDEI